MSHDGSTFQTKRNRILPYYPKEPVIFPYLKRNHSTPSLINNPETDSYQDTFSQFSLLNPKSTSDPSPTQIFTKNKTVSNDSTPKYQTLSYSSSLHDSLDNTIDSTDSDFECFQIQSIIQTHPIFPFPKYFLVLLTPPIPRYPLQTTHKLYPILTELLIPHTTHVH